MPQTISAKRIESDVHLKVTLQDSGVSIAWDSVDIKQVCMYSVDQHAFAGHCSFTVSVEDNKILLVTYPASEQLYTGDYRIVARLVLDGDEHTYDALAFTLKPLSDESGSITTEDVEVGIQVEEVDTTIMYEILTACQAATDSALAAEAAIEAAEAARVAAENLRVQAESAREAAEAARVQAEQLRVSAEASREEAEAARVQAEQARVTAENLRVAAETARVEAESARVTAENAREAAEAARVQAESARVAAEQGRVSAEAARVQAENAREAAEAARVQAEQARATAEAAREQQASSDHTRAEADHTRAEQDHAGLIIDEDVIAEHLAYLREEIRGLASVVDNLGDARARSLTLDTMLQICGSKLILSGQVAPAIAPDFVGQTYEDTSNMLHYVAIGNSSVSDWVALANKASTEALISGKVDKISGKGLSTNDYDNSEKEKNASNKSRLDTIEVVIAEHLASIRAELLGFASVVDNLGDARARSLSLDTMLQICGSKLILSGSGAPSAIPDFIGQEYCDTTNKKSYKAFGNSSVSDWVALN